MTALVIHDVPIECINHAATVYHIPATLLTSVLLTEGGRVGTAKKNTNGSFDYGPMQINTVWLSKLQQYGISRNDIQYNACVNVHIGAWILSQRIAAAHELGYGIGSYNSYSLPQNNHYRTKVSGIYNTLSYFLALPEEQYRAVIAEIKKQQPLQVLKYSFDSGKSLGI